MKARSKGRSIQLNLKNSLTFLVITFCLLKAIFPSFELFVSLALAPEYALSLLTFPPPYDRPVSGKKDICRLALKSPFLIRGKLQRDSHQTRRVMYILFPREVV